MNNPRQIVALQPGGLDVLENRPLDVLEPGEHELRIRHTAIGVNFIDVYFRTGLYPWPVENSLVLGSEAAGVVDAVGSGVSGFAVGDRVAYTHANGAYTTHRNLSASLVVKLPDEIPDDVAAAVMLKGLTASYLLNDSYAVAAGDTILFHAAAGGVGSLAGQWLKLKGATALGTAGGPEKCERAIRDGYDHVIDYRRDDVAEEVAQLTQQMGVDAVYDSVGKDTVPGSLASLKQFGTLVCFGQSSGPAVDFRISDLAGKSLRLTRPILFHYVNDRSWLDAAASELFGLIAKGKLKVAINQRYALDDVAQAHAALESRQTTGCTVLTV